MVRHETYWSTITNCNGAVEQELSYDAWGNQRDPETWCVDASITPLFDRGYTGHEHLNGFGLINMNGRMYDPVMSSFLSVDRYVQQPENSQGFNRYAYCMYNPLKYVDPSGWMMSRPSGSGGIPPQFKAPQPAAVDGGYRLVEIDGVLYGGCLIDTYAIDYACTSSSGGNNQAEQDCRELIGEQNHGVLFEDYPDEANVPTIRAGGGGGGGFWTGGNNTSAKSNGLNYVISFASYSNSTLGTLVSNNYDFYKHRATSEEIKQLGAKLRPHLKKVNSPLAKKSTMAIGKEACENLRIAGRVVGIGGLLIEGAEVYVTREIKPSNFLDIGITATCILCTGPAGWIIGGAYLIADIISYSYSGRSLGENMDHYIFNDWSKKLP